MLNHIFTKKNLMLAAFTTTILLITNIPAISVAQDLKNTLFKEAEQALQEAKKVQAEVLAPKSYGEAMKHFQDAENDFKKGRNLEDIRKKLRASVTYFKKAVEATKLAEVTFSTSMKARSDALNAEADEFAAVMWSQAENKFAEAGTKLEEGNVNDAKKKSSEAEGLYRQAELDAIKANYLNETWQLLKEAERQEVKKYAPRTLAQAQQLIKKAEKELNTNRYDTDVARDLARQAKYEARHALYLAKIVKQLREKKEAIEDYLLNAERPLSKIASTMDFVATFDAGFDKTTNEIIAYIKTYQDSVAALSQDLAERDQQIELRNARIVELEEKLGGIEQEKSTLAQRMKAQAKIREQFASVERIFSRNEAQVLREANDVIIRLVGLNFGVAKSTIEPQYFGLLTKVQQAINTFPECALTIEGHTDSHGSDETNLKLSQERAEAVRQYILANMGLEESRISAVGYGESKPIANNETVEGRTRNRRIEVIIHPQIPGTY